MDSGEVFSYMLQGSFHGTRAILSHTDWWVSCQVETLIYAHRFKEDICSSSPPNYERLLSMKTASDEHNRQNTTHEILDAFRCTNIF